MSFQSRINKAKHGLGPVVQAALSNGLPAIRGNWYAVDPYGQTLGTSPHEYGYEAVYTNLKDAYDSCVSGQGDGIVLISGGTGTSSQTTSYIKNKIVWSKHGITVVGLHSGTALFGRARVASQTLTTDALTDCAQSANAITSPTATFLTDGWEVGMLGRIADSGSNNGSAFTVTSVSETSLGVSETLNVQTAVSTVSTVLTSYLTDLISVTGSNNSFEGISFFQGQDDAASVGCIEVVGDRNAFKICHIVGMGHATSSAATNGYSLKLNGGSENTFYGCTIGTDSMSRTAANAEILIDGGGWRNRFKGCEILSFSSTSGHGAIKSADATSMNGAYIFTGCQFVNVKENGASALTSAFLGTAPTSGYILIDSSSLFGWAAWDSVGTNNTIYVANSDATASGAGGIATTI